MFHSKNLIINKSISNNVLPQLSKIKFGNIFSQHLLHIDWDINNGWGNPIIEEYKNSREKSQQIIAKDIHVRRWEKFSIEPQLKFLT